MSNPRIFAIASALSLVALASARPGYAQNALSVDINETAVNNALLSLTETRSLNWGKYQNTILQAWYVNVDSASMDVLPPSGSVNRMRLSGTISVKAQLDLWLFTANLSGGATGSFEGDVVLTGTAVRGYKVVFRPTSTSVSWWSSLPWFIDDLINHWLTFILANFLPDIELNVGTNLMPLGFCALPTLTTNASATAFVVGYPVAALACKPACPAGADCSSGEAVFANGGPACDEGSVCRPAVNDCDAPEYCTNNACPPDAKVADGTSCTDSTPGNCFRAQCRSGSCDQGYSYQPAGTSCNDTTPTDCYAAQCNGAGTCSQTACYSCCSCFPAGTFITMADGSTRPIESIVIGDRVLAYDTLAGRSVPAAVEKTFEHLETKESLVVVNGTLRATESHLFYAGGRWVRAADLRLGDELLVLPTGAAAQPATVPVVSLEIQPFSAAVYNLEVSGHHDYFAGGVLVHNKPLMCASCSSGGGDSSCGPDCSAGKACTSSAQCGCGFCHSSTRTCNCVLL